MDSMNLKNAKGGIDIPAIKKLTTKKLVEFCAKDIRPFEIVSGEGFKAIAQHFWSMGAIYGDMDITCVLAHSTTISRNVSSIKKEKLQKIVPIIENSIERGECSATTDMWTEDHKKNHFTTMTVHYVDKRFNLKRNILFTSKFKAKKKTGANIRKELKNRFKKIGLNDKLLLKMQFVTDQGSNVVKALKKPYKRDNCRCHLLNTILRNTFNSDDLPLIFLKTLTTCKKIVCYFKQSGKSNELKKAVVQDCETRWNYKLNMLLSVVNQYTEIQKLLSVKQRKTWAIDIDIAQDLIRFLEPFKEASNSMEGDLYPTANKILLWWGVLTEELDESKFENLHMKKLVQIAKKFFIEKYTVDMTNKIACFLDPRYRSLKMLTDDDRNEVYDKVKGIIAEEVSCRKKPPVQKSRFSRFEGTVHEDEFQLYMATADYDEYLEDANKKKHLVELFWRDNMERFPNLYKIARKRLHVPASSSSSERVFSDGKRTYDSRRANLDPDVMDDLLCIRDQFEIT